MDRSAVDRLYDCDVLDRYGKRIGPVAELWLADGRPLWASVPRADGTTLVPIRGAQVRDRRLVVPVDQEEVEAAPCVHGRELSEAELAELATHYGLPSQRLVRYERGDPVSGRTSRPARRAMRPAR